MFEAKVAVIVIGVMSCKSLDVQVHIRRILNMWYISVEVVLGSCTNNINNKKRGQCITPINKMQLNNHESNIQHKSPKV